MSLTTNHEGMSRMNHSAKKIAGIAHLHAIQYITDHHSILNLPPQERVNLEEQFWSKVEKTESCWIWKAGKTSGYGYFKKSPAHRIAYEFIKGGIPDDKTLDHLCRNRSCVNPGHLDPVSVKENVLRGIGITARQARQTHCAKGHPLEGENLDRYQLKKGRRWCRTCRNEYAREYAQKLGLQSGVI